MSRRKAFGCLAALVALAVLLALAGRLSRAWAERRLRAEALALERRTGGRQRASFAGLELDPLRLGGRLRGLRFETPGPDGAPIALEADELRLDRFRPEALGGAGDVDASVVGLRSEALERELERLPSLRGKLARPCRVDATLRLRYDAGEPRELNLSAGLRAPALGSLDLRLVTRGLAPAQLEPAARQVADWAAGLLRGEPPDEHALDGLGGTALVQAEALFRDGGLAQALLEREAGRLGLTPEQARDKLSVDLWRRLEPGAPGAPWTREAGTAAEAFLQQPRALRLTFEPPQPVELASLPRTAARGTQALAEELGFSAAANEPPSP